MEEANIKELREMIEKLQSSLATCKNIKRRWFKEANINDLKEVLDFLSDLKMEERSMIKHLISDLVELAQDLHHSDMFDIAHDIQNEINMTKTRMMNFGAGEKNVGGENEEQVVVGLDEDVHKLIYKAILNDSCGYHTWYIKGMIGIGKTTLARQVYNHKKVDGRFERRGWVSFSSGMSYKEVLVELIQQMVVGKKESNESDYLLEEKDNRSLRQMLRQHLQGKRFFIVFDNLFKGMRLAYILRDLLDEEGMLASFVFVLTYSFCRLMSYFFFVSIIFCRRRQWK